MTLKTSQMPPWRDGFRPTTAAISRKFATKSDGGWLINGEKIWSTTADTADYLLVIARSDKDAKKKHEGVSLFFIPRESEGISVTPLAKMGM